MVASPWISKLVLAWEIISSFTNTWPTERDLSRIFSVLVGEEWRQYSEKTFSIYFWRNAEETPTISTRDGEFRMPLSFAVTLRNNRFKRWWWWDMSSWTRVTTHNYHQQSSRVEAERKQQRANEWIREEKCSSQSWSASESFTRKQMMLSACQLSLCFFLLLVGLFVYLRNNVMTTTVASYQECYKFINNRPHFASPMPIDLSIKKVRLCCRPRENGLNSLAIFMTLKSRRFMLLSTNRGCRFRSY